MYKLVIIVPRQSVIHSLQEHWPKFLHLAERMPGLVRESHTRPHTYLYGMQRLELIQEFYFPDLPALEAALLSDVGQAAGSMLQEITGGRVTVLIAEHMEASLPIEATDAA
ncbi:MAG: hypothetical protein D6755_02900 [Anaerolineae bacterium]|nr:MAG: hypothetical protein D6755_02900 [Anaerolineae bacterium]